MKLASIPPQNLLILAAVGIAAYWFISRQAKAAGSTADKSRSFFTSPARPYAGLQSGSKYPDAGSLVGAVAGLFGPKRPAYQSAESRAPRGKRKRTCTTWPTWTSSPSTRQTATAATR